MCITSKHIYIAGPAIRLARKSAKFTMKLSSTCHAVLGKGVVSRAKQQTYHDCSFSLSLRQCIVFAS